MPMNGEKHEGVMAQPPAESETPETERHARLEVNQTAGAAADHAKAVVWAMATLDAQIRQTLGVVVRGILVSAPGLDPAQLLNSICRVTGNLCAGAVSGDIAAVLALRNGFKTNFAKGVSDAPLLQAPGTGAATGLGPRPPNRHQG